MKKIYINDFITMYQFQTEIKGFTINITAVFDGDDFVLIDTGYQPHLQQVMEDLDFKNLKAVIFTHHHPDHTFGAKLLSDIPLIGHIDYQTGFDEVYEIAQIKEWKVDGTVPTLFMNDGENYVFGNHTSTFYHHPIHTNSSMLIDLDGKYLFTGDEILSTIDGENVPSIFFAKAKLEDKPYSFLLKLSNGKIMIPGHGNVIYDNHKDIIEKRNLYVSLVKQGKQFSELTSNGYKCDIFEHFHIMNISLHSEHKDIDNLK